MSFDSPAPESDERWARLGRPAGLCQGCRHARLLASARSVFLRCDLSDQDPSFPRYPGLPVMRCGGFISFEG
jgi:hypothetical protein